ncbi:hypothetical protein SDC9_21671 [bioreactor metagenome]|uniref:Uncharacterized protein n=1 Tax=bioreactor metagenome TaxID=1076179 RepID=A0A644UA44_9ZZZZ|nr:hypothetical protein [Candidatus Elulimicrobiales bacterium]
MVQTKKEQLSFLFKTFENSVRSEDAIKVAKRIKTFIAKNKNLAEKALMDFPTAIGRVKSQGKISEENYKTFFKEVLPIVYSIAHFHLSFCEERSLERCDTDYPYQDLLERLFMNSYYVSQTASLRIA